VLNKIDSLPKEDHDDIMAQVKKKDRLVATSALTGEGIDRLLTLIDNKLGELRQEFFVEIDIADGKAVSWLYKRGEVLDRKDEDSHVVLKVSLDPADVDRFTSQFPYKLGNKKPRSKKKA
jgi:50S ribosomal subunit-associated GTPase HflX